MNQRRDPEDEELKRAFAELQAGDRRHTPPFEAVLAAARARTARPHSRVPLAAAAAAVLLLAAGAVTLRRLHSGTSQGALAVSEWQSPTAFLLRMPHADLLASVPRVSTSAINLDALWAPSTPSTRQ